MKNKTVRIIIYFLIGIQIIGYIGLVDSERFGHMFNGIPEFIGANFFLVIALMIYIISKKKEEKKLIESSETKLCKYCKSEINATATVCPICKRTLSISLAGVIVTLFICIMLYMFIFYPLIIYMIG